MVKAREAMPVGGGVARALRRLGDGVGWLPSAGRPRARLRDSQASMLVSPRTAAIGPRVPPVACSQTRVAERGGDAGGVGEGVRDVDEELEAEGEAVAHEARGDEDALAAAGELHVAMADGAGVELGGVGVGDEGGLGCLAGT